MSKTKAPVRVCTDHSDRLTDPRYTCGKGASEVAVLWTDQHDNVNLTTLRRDDFPNDEKFACTFLRDHGVDVRDETKYFVEVTKR